MDWIWTSVSAVILGYLLVRFLVNLKNSKKLPPGPIGLPILGHLHLFGNSPHKDLYRIARKHGPIIYLRFGFVPTVVVSSPRAAKLVLKTHDAIMANRPHVDGTKFLDHEHKSIILGHYGPSWRNMRKLCTLELLSPLKINFFCPMRKAEVGQLIDSLRKAADLGEIVDISGRVSDMLADIICLMVFGKKFENKKMGDHDMEFRAVSTEATEILGRMYMGDHFPFLGVLDLQGLRRRLKALAKTFDVFLNHLLDQRFVEKTQAHDFVDTLIGLMDSREAGFEFGRPQIKAVLQDMFVAGLDTSSAAIEWTMSELLRHPTVMAKLQAEMDTVVGRGTMVEESHLESLTYLDAVVKEVLRLRPVTPFLVPHESMEDCQLDEFHIPKGTRIIVNTWAIGRDPDVWDDPERFWPERFLGSNIDVRGHDFELLPYGSGRRMCPGMNLGHLVVQLVVAQLVHCFSWELPNGMGPADLDMSEHFGFVASKATHLMAIPSYRFNN